MKYETEQNFMNDATIALNAGERLYNDLKKMDFSLALGTICVVIDRLAFLHNLSEREVYQMIYDVHGIVEEVEGEWKENENAECTD